MKCPLSSRCEREHQRCDDRALFGTTDCEGCVGLVADLDGCEHELAAVARDDINRSAVAYPIARNDVASFADEVTRCDVLSPHFHAIGCLAHDVLLFRAAPLAALWFEGRTGGGLAQGEERKRASVRVFAK